MHTLGQKGSGPLQKQRSVTGYVPMHRPVAVFDHANHV
jgi:hypothetical protein